MVCAALLVGGCSSPAIREQVLQAGARATAVPAQASALHQERAAGEVALYQRLPGLWVTDRVLPRSAAQNLPALFDQPFAYRSAEPVPLGLFAADLQRATGVPVRIVGEAVARAVMLDFVGTARQAMETIPDRYGVSWELSEGAIVITQSLVRMFRIERSGVDVGGSAGNRKDPWDEFEAQLRVIAPNARVHVSRTNNTITVVGAPLAMPEIEKLAQLDARQAARRIVLRWQLVNYRATAAGEAGLALNYLLNRSGGMASLVAGSASQTPGAGVLTLARTDPQAASNGSSAAISLLNASGSAVLVREGFVPLQHNDTQEFGNTRTIFYASKSSLVAVPSTGSTNVNATAIVTEQASINVGLDGKFGVSVFDSEQAELSYEFAVTVLDALRKQQTAVQYQEYPETSQRRARGRIRVAHGQTYIISTDTAESSSFDRRGLLPGQAAVLGGSESAALQNDQWLLLVTPVITSSAM